MAFYDVKGKKVSVIGAERSGVAAAHLLQSKGAIVFVSDKQPSAMLKNFAELQSLGVAFEIGQHTERIYDARLIVTSPGVPANSSVLQEATRRRIDVVSELEIASWFCPAPIIGVTGSNGKTTTTTLLGRMFGDAQKKHIVAGNIGTAFSALVSEAEKDGTAIVEVSSFQLDHIKQFHPYVSIILNITPDHLDRYNNSFEQYIVSKCRIFENQTMSDYLIYNNDDAVTREHVNSLASSHVHLLPLGIENKFNEGAYIESGMLYTELNGKKTEIIPVKEISIKGIHNLYNSMAATLAAQLMGINPASIRATLKNFKGVEHRLELVREVNGVKYINDSKATNVDSVWYALQAYDEPIVLLLGGRDKGNDYSRLLSLVEKHVKAIIAIGESADKVVKEFSSRAKTAKATTMNDAVNLASELATAGNVVLLSPACASFDWFENYEHRGNVFKQLVNEL